MCQCLRFLIFIDGKYHPNTHAHGPLARWVKLRVAHAPGMPGTFSPPPRVSDPDMHQWHVRDAHVSIKSRYLMLK